MLNENEPEPAPNENELEPPLIRNVLEPPLIETEPEPAVEKDRSLLIIGVIFLAIILLTTCVSIGLFLTRRAQSRQTPTQEIPAVFIPTATSPAGIPVNLGSIHLPVILAEPANIVSTNIWMVTKINSLAYKSGGQRSDLATFKRIDSQDIAQGYCINKGWPTPKIGAEYSLNSQGIFVPLQEPKAHPLQRFQKIQ